MPLDHDRITKQQRTAAPRLLNQKIRMQLPGSNADDGCSSNTAYRDTDWQREQTSKMDRYYFTWRRHKSELVSVYLTRIGTRNGLRDDPTRVDSIVQRFAVPLGELVSKGETLVAKIAAQVLTRGYCCCTDVVRLSASEMSKKLSLHDFQLSARAGCERCWFIAECVANFAANWAGVQLAEVKVYGGPALAAQMLDYIYGNGSTRVFRVHWLDPHQRQPWQTPSKWRCVVLELYCDQGTATLLITNRY